MSLMSVLRTSVVGLVVMSCTAIATSAFARDRPGTPTDLQMAESRNKEQDVKGWRETIDVGLLWRNTAGKEFKIGGTATERHPGYFPELVGFEVEMTKNGNRYAPPSSSLDCLVTQVACWCPTCFDFQTKPAPNNEGTVNRVGFKIRDVDPNTKYCFRVRARRKSDQVVSANWSGTSCITTGSPAAPQPPPPPAVPEKPIKHTGRGNACIAYGDRMSAITGEARGLGCKFVQTAPWNNPHDYWVQRCTAHSGDDVADSEEAKLKQRLSDCKAAGGSGAGAAGGGGDQAGSSCGGGTATVAINQPGLDKLNVRNGPDGQVTGTVPEGATVSVTGPCGETGAAGIIANKQGGGDGGWCRISAPVAGCVSARFLKFGGGAAGFAKSAAGFAKPKTQEPAPMGVSFSGQWAANADNVAYTVSLRQKGNSVSGSYQGSDGSAGTINGKMNGNTLRFGWVQKDGTRGSGKFVLADDGQSFDGTYSFGNDPDAVEGNWNGTRQ